MQIRQLVTVLGLCLFQARAMIVNEPFDNALKSFVMFMTPSDAPVHESKKFQSVADALKYPGLSSDPHSLQHIVHHSIAPIMRTNQENLPYIYAGYDGYLRTVKSSALKHEPATRDLRLSLYRSAIYNELKAMVDSNPEMLTPENLEHLRGHLLPILNPQAGVHQSNHANPTAKLVEQFREEAENVFRTEPKGIKAMDREEINKQLEATNKNKNVPAALLINKRFGNNLIGHYLKHHAHHDHHAHFASAGVPSSMHAVPVA
ncbi:hypothetical protein PGTUg99_008125 [Puccinia graminis f. sp. tritici]|uniref:Uncharacterized protein n=1 Tax=Puccinia graminis f. sp. tritici TaxID=56615 RepID=A0A5B0QKY7_PUCGR|nr:hypothetical protein PGTUg99_008125 [Puccinia graminis f. sp. tritici]